MVNDNLWVGCPGKGVMNDWVHGAGVGGHGGPGRAVVSLGGAGGCWGMTMGIGLRGYPVPKIIIALYSHAGSCRLGDVRGHGSAVVGAMRS